MKNNFIILLILLSCIGCNKVLDKKPSKSLVVPQTLRDLQAILDNNYSINLSATMFLGEASADNFYLTDAAWSSLPFQADQSVYLWDREIFFNADPSQNEWSTLYSIVYKANVVLDAIKHMQADAGTQQQWNNVKGSALFLRGFAFSVLARDFTLAYDSTTANTDLGIPLRLSIDFNETSTRANLQATYNQIIDDLTGAVSLLPDIPLHVMRPSKPAANGVLSRIYLSIRNFQKAASCAAAGLQTASALMDYNGDPGINSALLTPFAKFNKEVIFNEEGTENSLYYDVANIDTLLYNSYVANDLRKSLYFIDHGDGTFGFKGNYTGDISLFSGVATDELMLTKAECMARAGDASGALTTLNDLLIKRWKTGTYVPYAASNAQTALQIVLTERRKELLMRDLRWMDIKRFNKEGANISIKRTINNQQYNLKPNDNRFALPLPQTIIQLTGMPQNPR